MPYQPTNLSPYNTAIDLNSENLQFHFKIDDYDTIESFKVEIYDLLKNQKLYTVIRTVGSIENNEIIDGEEQLIQILDENDQQILLTQYEYQNTEYEKYINPLPLYGGQGAKSVGELNITQYLIDLLSAEKRRYYGEIENYKELIITEENAFEIDDKGVIIKYIKENNSYKSQIVVPYKIHDVIVTGVDNSVFSEDVDIQTVIIPSCVINVNEAAFKNCKALEKVGLNTGISSFGNFCFYGCENLVDINLVSSISVLGESCFENCLALTEIELPRQLKILPNKIFANTSLQRLICPDELITIGEESFSNCQSLESVIYNDKLQNIEVKAFYNCIQLNNVKLNDNLKYLKNNVFQNCSNLLELVIPSSIIEIGEGVLNGCTSLYFLTLPFIGTSKDTNKTERSVLGHIFGKSENGITQKYSDNLMSTYAIPFSLEKVVVTNCSIIPYGAFYNCTSIFVIELCDTIIRLEDYSFYNCVSLTTIELSPNISYIGNYAFALENKKILN